MPKELTQIRRKKTASYPDKQEYLGKLEKGEAGTNSGAPLNESEPAVEQVEEVEQEQEQEEETTKKGVLGDLPEEIQNYVKQQVQRSTGMDMSNTPEPMGAEQVNEMFEAPMPELSQKEQELQKAIDEYTQKEIEKACDELEKMLNDDLEEDAQQEQADNTPQNEQEATQEQEKEKDEYTCTKSERDFLDAFMLLQEAGGLLGLVPSSHTIKGGAILNTRLVPILNEEKPSDKLYIQELQKEAEVYMMLQPHINKLFTSARNVLNDKGIKSYPQV